MFKEIKEMNVGIIFSFIFFVVADEQNDMFFVFKYQATTLFNIEQFNHLFLVSIIALFYYL